MNRIFKILTVLLFLWNAPQTICQTISYYATGEEFPGFLPSWKNVMTDFGAKGDGITDDAPAITAALSTFADMFSIDCSVLYFPAGTYRLGSTILNAGRGQGGNGYAGLAIIGEDPSTTILLWDGPEDSTMFLLDGWSLKVSRLTFDGQNKAMIGLLRDGMFGTTAEYSDLVFKDLYWGVQLGGDYSGMGQAENLFMRCRFFNCDCAIYAPNMNSVDTWIWYCLFQDCSWGVNLGGYHAYGNVFLRSKTCDLGLSWPPSCIVNNISINTKCFNKWCENVLYQGNEIYDPDTTLDTYEGKIYDTVKAFAVPPTSVLLDNIIKTSGDAGTAVQLFPSGNCISVGNTFTQLWPIRPKYEPYARGMDGFEGSVCLAVDDNVATVHNGYLYIERPSGIAWYCSSGKARAAVKYSLTTGGNYRELDLKSFKLVGSNDWGYHFTVLDSQVNQTWTGGETKTFAFQNTTPFAMYRLDVIETNQGSYGTFSVAEFSLIDTGGASLMKDPGGFVAGSEEIWGGYYSIQERTVPYDSIVNPEVIELPGTPPLVARRIFEIRKGTPDDATEIQKNIDSAAALPAGTRPIVHIPKGTYTINKTIFLPANVEMTLSGDGTGVGGTILLSDPGLTGPTMKIEAPGQLLVRDIIVEGNEAIYAVVDDRPGSRVTGKLFFFGGWDWIHFADTAMIIDGIEQSDMLFSGICDWCCYNGVLVKGGPILSSGGSTNGQIAFLGGSSGFGQNMWETQKNGKLIAQGLWYEADMDYTKSFINLTEVSSGSLAIAGMNWAYSPNPNRPIVSIDNFSGQCTVISNNFLRIDDKLQWWRLTGNGTQGRILNACNKSWLGSDSAAIVDKWPYWVDQTSPSAAASRIFCSAFFYPDKMPDITDKIMNTLPDSSSLLSSLALMRSLRIEKPTAPLPENSHIDFIRVQAACQHEGTSVRFIASPDPYGRPESSTLIAPLNDSTDVPMDPTMIWNASTGASSYHLQVSESVFFNPIVFEDSSITDTTQLIGPLANNTVYFWRVMAKNSNGQSTWSRIWSFTTSNSSRLPESPILISPLNGSIDVTIDPIMNWKASTGSSSYRLQVSENTIFNPVVFEDSAITVTTQQIGPLANNTIYFWRVMAKNSNGNSPWSSLWSFTTGTITSIEQISPEILSEYSLCNNPNPFYLSTFIAYSIPLKVTVILKVFDIMGREITTLVNEEQIAGKYEVKYDGSKLPRGIYLYSLQAGEYSGTRKMVLIR